MTESLLDVRRVRHELRRRRVQVSRVTRLSPHIVSITFIGPDLAGFTSASFDDHVKLMLPPAGASELVLPELGPDGPSFPEGAPRPVMRDYTPRRFDAAALELDIEFAVHGDGPAATWAAQAQPGQAVGIGGPRGSFLIPEAFDWHLLVGDDTALPAIARRLEELPAGKRVIAVLAVAPEDRRELPTKADVAWHWCEPSDLIGAVRALKIPDGAGYSWAAGEAKAMAAVREVLVGELGVDRSRVRAAAYWKQGAPGHHERIE